MSELKSKTLKGLIWSSIDTYGVFFIKLVFSITIARLLQPEDYGLIGMIAIFIAFGSMFTDGGFQDALIQKKEPTDLDFSSVFYFKMVIAVTFYIILFFSANAIGDFYNEPRVIPIAKVMGITFVIGALGSIHVAWFIKKMDFKAYAAIRTSSSLFSGTVAVTAAYFDLGVWALVLQSLAGTFLNTLLFWIVNKWRPKLMFSYESMKQLFSFGWKMFAQRLMFTVFSNIYYPIIGKIFAVDVLGYYTRARKFQEIAVLQTQIAFNKVLFPAFSSMQDDRQKFSKAAKKSFMLQAFFIFPLIVVLIVTSKSFVLFFLTEKWIMLIPYLQLLYSQGFIVPFIMFNNSMINALGRSDISLKINLGTKIFFIAGIVTGIYFGIFGLIVAGIITSFISYLITAKICGDKIGFTIKKQIGALIPLLLISSIAFIAGFSCFLFEPIHNLLLMMLQIIIVLSVYIVLARILKLKSYLELRNLFREKLPEKYRFIL